jgi:hypothetical protein
MSKDLGDLKRLHHKLAIALGDGHSVVLQLEAEIAECTATFAQPARYECAAKVREIRRSYSQRLRNLSDSAA